MDQGVKCSAAAPAPCLSASHHDGRELHYLVEPAAPCQMLYFIRIALFIVFLHNSRIVTNTHSKSKTLLVSKGYHNGSVVRDPHSLCLTDSVVNKKDSLGSHANLKEHSAGFSEAPGRMAG